MSEAADLPSHDDFFHIPVADLQKQHYVNAIQMSEEYGGKSVNPWPFQADAAWSVIDATVNEFALEMFWLWARKQGKTFTAASSAKFIAEMPAWVDGIWWKHGIDICCFGPKEKQATLIYDELLHLYRTGWAQDELDLDIKLGAESIIIKSDRFGREFTSRIFKSTASARSSIEGPTLGLAYIDEAQDVTTERILKSIMPMMSTTAGSMVMLGTSTYEHEYYFMEKYQRMLRDNYYPPNTSVMWYDTPGNRKFFDKKYKKTVDGYIRAQGMDSPHILASYFGKIVQVGRKEFALIPEPNFGDHRQGLIINTSTEPCYVVIDVGQEVDATVVFIIRATDEHILNVLWIPPPKDGSLPMSYQEMAHTTRQFLLPYWIYAIVIEKNGPGKVLGDILAAPPFGVCPVCKIDFTHYPHYPPSNRAGDGGITHFIHVGANMTTQAEKFRDDWNSKVITYPDVDTEEFLQMEKEIRQLLARREGSNGKKLWVGHPARKGYHDDFPKALMLRLHANSLPIPDLSWAKGDDDEPRGKRVRRQGMGRGSRSAFSRIENTIARMVA